jgi:hypothetical protein
MSSCSNVSQFLNKPAVMGSYEEPSKYIATILRSERRVKSELQEEGEVTDLTDIHQTLGKS